MHGIKKSIWNARLFFSGNVPKKRKKLSHWQNLEKSELAVMQESRMRALMRHASEHVPYYQKVFNECGFVEDDKVHLDRFPSVPLLDKEVLRSQSDELRSTDLDRREWHFNTSGGSTGEPVRFIQDQEQVGWMQASKQLFNQWSGYEVGMPRIRLWGSERDLKVGRESFRTRMGQWLRNEVWLNAYRMSTTQMQSYVDRINSFRPVQILAYAESIYELAQYIERKSLEVYAPDAIMTSAGTLYPHMRETIEEVFRAPTFNRYGSREVGDIACECEEHKGLHVVSPVHYVEVIKSNGVPAAPGEMGEVIVTPLTNFAMPLIRYRIGDMAVRSEKACDCGRAWPLLKEVTGRVSDTFVTKDGKRVRGGYFTRLFYFRDWVKKYQVIQEEYDRICIRIVLQDSASRASLPKEDLSEIKKGVRMVMGEMCEVQFEFKKEIVPTESGKYRYTISKVQQASL